MGQPVRVVRVPRAVTWILLLLLSAAMAAGVYALSGKAYAVDEHPVRDALVRVVGSGRVPPRSALLAVMMPVIANVLLFVPWGVLAFLALDRPGRPRVRSHVLTVAGALLFAGSLLVWQHTLPTRLTTGSDVLANGGGALVGAILGQLRRDVRVKFEVS